MYSSTYGEIQSVSSLQCRVTFTKLWLDNCCSEPGLNKRVNSDGCWYSPADKWCLVWNKWNHLSAVVMFHLATRIKSNARHSMSPTVPMMQHEVVRDVDSQIIQSYTTNWMQKFKSHYFHMDSITLNQTSCPDMLQLVFDFSCSCIYVRVI